MACMNQNSCQCYKESPAHGVTTDLSRNGEKLSNTRFCFSLLSFTHTISSGANPCPLNLQASESIYTDQDFREAKAHTWQLKLRSASKDILT